MSARCPVEPSPPGLEPCRGGEDGVHVLDAAKSDPNVTVQALTHGNEICGAIALRYRPREKFRPARRPPAAEIFEPRPSAA